MAAVNAAPTPKGDQVVVGSPQVDLEDNRNRLLSESSTDGLENMMPLELDDLKHFNDRYKE